MPTSGQPLNDRIPIQRLTITNATTDSLRATLAAIVAISVQIDPHKYTNPNGLHLALVHHLSPLSLFLLWITIATHWMHASSLTFGGGPIISEQYVWRTLFARLLNG